MIGCLNHGRERERERERERDVLFNDALNTFYLRLYGVRHMVKDHSDSEKGNPLPPHRLLLSINSKTLCLRQMQHIRKLYLVSKLHKVSVSPKSINIDDLV